MRVLAIETSTMLGGVAVIDESGLVVESRLNIRTAHSERLMRGLEQALGQAGMTIEDMDAIAVSRGPGSFTGLRIGLSTVKGIAYATGKPVVAVPTLEAFAWNFAPAALGMPICPMLDARKKEVYAAAFVWEAGEMESVMRRLVPEASVHAGDFAAQLPSAGKILFAGEGSVIYREDILSVLKDRAVFAPAHLMVPLPSSTAYLGRRLALEGRFEDPASLTPLYIRKSEAELKDKALGPEIKQD